MALPYFYEKNIPATSSFFLAEETSRHCIQVLRMKVGEQLLLTDGCGNLCTATIIKEDKKHCAVSLSAITNTPATTRRVTIAVSLIKNNTRLEWLIEKATEIGVSAIVPLICQRTEKQNFRPERMQAILISAMLQSRRNWLPALTAPVHFTAFIKEGYEGQKLIAHCEEAQKQTITNLASAGSVQILIGPEGDFSPSEIDLAVQQGYIPVSLGYTRLRTETAAMVAATLLVNH